jgi:hypothetical protein
MQIDNKNAAFKDADWYGKCNRLISIAGAGGTGSWLALFLARNNFEILIYDDQKVERRNMSGQFYKGMDEGSFKITSLHDNIVHFADKYINTSGLKLTESNFIASNYFFSCVDNMEARKNIFDNWKRRYKDVKDAIFIDLRLELELLQVYAVTSDRIEDYEKTLSFEGDKEEAICSLKQTTHNAAMIAAIATNMFLNFLVNISTGSTVRQVSFFTEYFSPVNVFTDD